MIVPISGKVHFPITIDPTVWIFDERKIIFEEAFLESADQVKEDNELELASQRWSRAVSANDNKGISRIEGKEILKNSYVMPIYDFIKNAEIRHDAKNATLVIGENARDNVTISIEELENAYLQFAIKGKPIREDGPVYFLYEDGSNKDNPIKNVKKVIIN